MFNPVAPCTGHGIAGLQLKTKQTPLSHTLPGKEKRCPCYMGMNKFFQFAAESACLIQQHTGGGKDRTGASLQQRAPDAAFCRARCQTRVQLLAEMRTCAIFILRAFRMQTVSILPGLNWSHHWEPSQLQ